MKSTSENFNGSIGLTLLDKARRLRSGYVPFGATAIVLAAQAQNTLAELTFTATGAGNPAAFGYGYIPGYWTTETEWNSGMGGGGAIEVWHEPSLGYGVWNGSAINTSYQSYDFVPGTFDSINGIAAPAGAINYNTGNWMDFNGSMAPIIPRIDGPDYLDQQGCTYVMAGINGTVAGNVGAADSVNLFVRWAMNNLSNPVNGDYQMWLQYEIGGFSGTLSMVAPTTQLQSGGVLVDEWIRQEMVSATLLDAPTWIYDLTGDPGATNAAVDTTFNVILGMSYNYGATFGGQEVGAIAMTMGGEGTPPPVIPEPTSMSLALLVGVIAMWWRRRFLD